MKKVKIYGAGSIGNHLAQASRRMGWSVVVVDSNQEALVRMRDSIYPTRYGAWDDSISLYKLGDEPRGGFDIIMLGTPPDVRMKLAIKLIDEKPTVMLLEKPLCTPACDGLEEFIAKSKSAGIMTFVGYDHAISPSIMFVTQMLRSRAIGEIVTIDVEFREHWGGIFKAHPWLSGPQDTYLGFTERGGGASGEHSHALHLWYVLSQAANPGEVSLVSKDLHMVKDGQTSYDDLAFFTLQTEEGVMGRVVQDVVTLPTRKWARIQGKNGFIEWECGVQGGDIVRYKIEEKDVESKIFTKMRPDDFFQEMLHIESCMNKDTDYDLSPIAGSTGVFVMKVLNNK